MIRTLMSRITALLAFGSLAAAALAGNPRELGAIRWHRGFDKTVASAKKACKPVLILFQEVPGFLRDLEVVEVEFDPTRVSYEDLVKKAGQLECASRVFTRSDEQQKAASRLVGSSAVRADEEIRLDKEPKYYLSKTDFKYIPMTALQAARVNAAIGAKKDPIAFLAPGQKELLAAVRKHPCAGWRDAIGTSDVVKAWNEARERMQKAGGI